MTIDIPAAARRAVAWQLLRPTARPFSACAVMTAAMEMLPVPEEECGLEIMDAVCGMIRQGRVACSTASDDGSSITIGAATMLVPLFAMDALL